MSQECIKACSWNNEDNCKIDFKTLPQYHFSFFLKTLHIPESVHVRHRFLSLLVQEIVQLINMTFIIWACTGPVQGWCWHHNYIFTELRLINTYRAGARICCCLNIISADAGHYQGHQGIISCNIDPIV